MKAEEKARELYKIFDVNEFDETLKDRIIYVNAIAKREQNAYIKGHEEGKDEANAEWQEKVKLSTSLIEQSLDNLKNTNYELDRRGWYKVIYDALEIIGEK